jgi:hypothetical protein
MVDLSPKVVEKLTEWRKVQGRYRKQWGAAWEDGEGHVFKHLVTFSRTFTENENGERREGTHEARHGVPLRPDWVSKAKRGQRKWSAWPDLNWRPLVPQTSALTRLRHTPTV